VITFVVAAKGHLGGADVNPRRYDPVLVGAAVPRARSGTLRPRAVSRRDGRGVCSPVHTGRSVDSALLHLHYR
jgi:hypothetical protein